MNQKLMRVIGMILVAGFAMTACTPTDPVGSDPVDTTQTPVADTDGYVGSAPDIGAYEYGADPFSFGS